MTKDKNESNLISAELPDEMIKKLDNLAYRQGLNRNEIIAKCLEYALKNISSNDETGSK